MARARSPARDKAFEIYKEHKGDITNRAIADQLETSEKTVGGWKSKDNWKEQLNGVLQKKKRSTPIKKEVKEPIVESDDLTDKQRLFISYYIKSWNATKAYLKAYGCAYSTALTNGPALLRNARIRKEIILVRDSISEDALLNKRTLIQKWMDIAFADITDYLKFGRQEEIEYNEDGSPAIDMNGNLKTYSFNYVHLNDSSEIDGTLVTEVKQGKDGISVKLADKMKALDMLTKYFDLLSENDKKKLQEEKLKAEIERLNRTDEDNETEKDVAAALRGLVNGINAKAD